MSTKLQRAGYLINQPSDSYYEEGQFGIRIENILITIPVETPSGSQFCGFETVSFAPIQSRLVDAQTLSADELAWLNDYHQQVRTVLTPLMQQVYPEALEYLNRETQAITHA